MKEEKVLIKNLLSNYKVEGEGEPLLILHGWGASSDSWVEVQKKLSKADFKVISVDFPGFGQSENPKTPWDVSEYADWLEKFLNKLDIKKFNVIAHSFGGRVVAKLKNKNQIRKLILVAPAGIKVKPSWKTQILLTLSALGDMIFRIKPLSVLRGAAKSFYYLLLRRRDYVKAEGVMRDSMKLVLKEDLTPYLSEIKSKTLIIWGDKDKVIPIKYANVFKENIVDSKLEILEDVAHSPHLEVPERLSRVVLNFL